jgi:anti-sigma B factor antagonist
MSRVGRSRLSTIAVMAGELLSVRTERRGSAYHVEPAGELDIATAEVLEHELQTAEQSDAETIVLDLSGLAFMDSTGLRVVIDVNDRCGGEHGRLRVIAGSPAVERLLDIVGLRERLPLITP